MLRRLAILSVLFIAGMASAFGESASSIPTKIPTYWGTSASPSLITCPIPIPDQTGIALGRASWTTGFPSANFLPSGAGGVPPFGQDMNGAFCQLSQWARWYNTVGGLPYDATFQSAIGGYPTGAIVASLSSPGVYWRSTANNNTSNPDTGGANWTLAFGLLQGIYNGAGTGTAQTVTLPGINSLSALQGQIFSYGVPTNNTGPITLAVNGLTAKNIYAANNINGLVGLYPLSGSEMLGGKTSVLMYDGTEYVLLNPFPASYTTFYVATTGTDTGLCTVSTSPCRTIQYAVSAALQSNAGGQIQTVQVGAGTFSEDVVVQGKSRNSGSTFTQSLVIQGGGSSTTFWQSGNSTQCGVLTANNGANISIQNLKITANGALGCKSALFANLGGYINVFADTVFGSANHSMFQCEEPNSLIEIWNTFSIAGNAQVMMDAETGCMIQVAPTGVTIAFASGGVFSSAVFNASALGLIVLQNYTVTNSATGKKFVVDMNAVINATGGCANLPGTVAGTTSSGGQCP